MFHRVRAAHGANKVQSVFRGGVYAAKNTLRGVKCRRPAKLAKARNAAKSPHARGYGAIRPRTLLREFLHVSLRIHIEHAARGDAQARDHRQRHEAQRHERVDRPVYAETERLVLRGLEGTVDHLETVIGHDARDGQRHLAEHRAAVHNGDAAAVFDDPVRSGGHILLRRADDDDVVAVVADGGRNSAVRQPVAPDIAETDVVRVLMPLDDGDFQDILRGIDMVGIAAVDGDDLPRHHADHGVGALVAEVPEP